MSDEVARPRITFTDPSGDVLVVAARPGDSVMTTAKRLGIPGIRGDCGGFMACATCHVYVDQADFGALAPLGALEEEMLWGTAADRRDTSRLSCQIQVDGDTDLHITLPDRQV
jgi:2Fe-2S ferredoxin